VAPYYLDRNKSIKLLTGEISVWTSHLVEVHRLAPDFSKKGDGSVRCCGDYRRLLAHVFWQCPKHIQEKLDLVYQAIVTG
jgi:hypothetical protein